MNKLEHTLNVLHFIRMEKGWTISEYQILLMLAANGPSNHNDIGQIMGLRACHPYLWRLVKDGLATKERRNNRIFFSITPAGEQKAAEIIQGKPIKSHL